jgi:hypothetical protein
MREQISETERRVISSSALAISKRLFWIHLPGVICKSDPGLGDSGCSFRHKLERKDLGAAHFIHRCQRFDNGGGNGSVERGGKINNDMHCGKFSMVLVKYAKFKNRAIFVMV